MAIERCGPYHIERLLGRGGMGTVYAGVHEQTGERAAIKVLSDAIAKDERSRDRFRGEVETLKKLRHRNIVTLHGFGEQEGQLFFVMELVEGRSLEDELDAGRRYTWREVAEIGIQVCAALKHAHDHGVIHRDLKPANLLLTADGTIKLTDFGIAKFYGGGSLTVAGSIIGTPYFMPPEQADYKPVTARSDLYSLGCVMYALMAGKPPFTGGSMTNVLDQVRFEEPAPLRYVADHVPYELDEIIGQLLKKNPADRFATAMQLSNLLQAMKLALSTDGPQGGKSADGALSRAETVDGQEGSDRRDGDDPAALSCSEQPTIDGTPSEWAEKGDSNAVARKTRRSSAHARATIANAETSAADAVAEKGPQTHFTTVSKEDWRRGIGEPDRPRRKTSERLITVCMALTLIAILSACVVAFWPESADRLYERIQALPQSLDSAYARIKLIDEFIRRFPDDPRCPHLVGLRLDAECRSLYGILQNKLRTLTDEEKLFMSGMQAFDQGMLEDARECFRHIVDELGPDAHGMMENRLVARSQHMLKKIAVASPGSADPPNH
jgi:serine/threonine-protein kinase